MIIPLAAVADDLEFRPAKYEPPAGKVLVFVGQDNASVGGNDRFTDGYVDYVGVPAGITHYIGIGGTTEEGLIPGLSVESMGRQSAADEPARLTISTPGAAAA